MYKNIDLIKKLAELHSAGILTDDDKMTDLLISSGDIGTGTIQDLKMSKYFKDGIRFFAWTNHKVYLKKI